MAEKQCFKCKITKPLDEFYKHGRMGDGYLGKCKECNKQDVRENYAAKRDQYRAYEKRRAMLPHRVEARKKYEKSEAGKASSKKSRKAWIADNPKKRWCAVSVGNAVRDGKLIKSKSCSSCGVTGKRIHGHHDDYDKVFDVRWLCSACHISWHKQNGEGKNAK